MQESGPGGPGLVLQVQLPQSISLRHKEQLGPNPTSVVAAVALFYKWEL